MTFSEYEAIKATQDEKVNELSNRLNNYSKESNGLIVEKVRLSKEYRALKAEFQKEFSFLQKVNKVGNLRFKKELAQKRKAKRLKLMA